MDLEERYAFLAEYYDPNACLIRKYQLLFYVKDETCEMYDIKNKRLFLRRTKVPELKMATNLPEESFVQKRRKPSPLLSQIAYTS